MTKKEAIEYINQASKYGYDVPDIENMTDEELIAWAEYNGDKGDFEAQK